MVDPFDTSHPAHPGHRRAHAHAHNGDIEPGFRRGCLSKPVALRTMRPNRRDGPDQAAIAPEVPA